MARLPTSIRVVVAGCGAVVLSALATAQETSQSEYAEQTAARAQQRAAWERFAGEHPGALRYEQHGRLRRVYGEAFGHGLSPQETAEAFLDEYCGMLGAQRSDLVPGSSMLAGAHTVPLMFDAETGTFKFTLVCYQQERDGVPVFRSDVRLLVRNKPGFPLVLVASNLRELGEFAVGRAAQSARFDLGRAAAQALVPGLTRFTEPRGVIWAGTEERPDEPTAALTFMGTSGEAGLPPAEKWLFVTRADTGQILYRENLIIFEDVVGHVDGVGTGGPESAPCSAAEVMPLPYARVSIGETAAYTDAAGDFAIPNGGTGAVTVESTLSGQYFGVHDFLGNDSVVSETVVPPGPSYMLHNAGDLSSVRAQVDAYAQANVVREFVLAQNPSYPTISTQLDFPLYVNRTDVVCPGNAWYDGSSLNFCHAGGWYPNTAFSSVIHHEYGHHVVATGGSGQGPYGEGMADSIATLIADDPVMGYGFFGDCDTGLRTADNDYQYPCYGDDHDCGQLLSGCLWSTRNELAASYADTYLDILSELTVNSVPLHTGVDITPQITIDLLTLDDDDGDIRNGTPHYAEICAGFGAHYMNCPVLHLVDFVYPRHRPTRAAPGRPTSFTVQVAEVSAPPVSGSGQLHYSLDGVNYTTVNLSESAPNEYTGVLPAAACGQRIRWYVSAEVAGYDTVTDPKDAPETVHTTVSADRKVTIPAMGTDWYVVNSEDLTTGAWELGWPVGGGDRGDPPTPYPVGLKCFLTGNQDGNSDVDGGSTTLFSGAHDLRTAASAVVTYARWYTNDVGDNPATDWWVTQISDGAGGWVDLERTDRSPHAWVVQSFHVEDYVGLGDSVRVRFIASDPDPGAIVEAGVDEVYFIVFECDPDCACGDVDGSGGAVDLNDLAAFSLCFGLDGPSAECDQSQFVCADLNGDGEVTLSDFATFAILFGKTSAGMPPACQ